MKENDTQRVIISRGKHVTLRPLMRSDIPRFLVWFNDREVTQYLSIYLPMYEKEEEEWVEKIHARKNTDVVFAIDVNKNTHIGTIGLHEINWKDRVAHVGIAIGDKNYWGKGFGTEAMLLLLEYAFNTLNLRKITLTVFNFNKRGICCYKKCGFGFEGCLKRHMYKNGRYANMILMAIFKKDWAPIWKKYRKNQ